MLHAAVPLPDDDEEQHHDGSPRAVEEATVQLPRAKNQRVGTTTAPGAACGLVPVCGHRA